MYKYSENHLYKYLFNFIPSSKNAVFLTFHNFTEPELIWFRKFINRYQNRIKSIDEFDYNNLNENDIFLTFDDGFYSNYCLAKDILNNYKIKALFFITNNFIDLDFINSHNFANKSMYPKRNILYSKDYKSMSWSDVKYLIDSGHEIGSHTLTHPNLANLHSSVRYNEIANSKTYLESKLNIKINSFAYPFGSPLNINSESLNIVENVYKNAFTNVRGSIINSPSNHLILRQNIVPGMPFWLTDAIVDSKLDFMYLKQRKKLKYE